MKWLRVIARNKRKFAILTAYLLLTVVIVVWRASMYRDAPSVWIPVARGSAAGIYLNFALVLLPMMRLTLSRRSMGPLRVLLPFHNAIESHVIAGSAILFFSGIHVVAYGVLLATAWGLVMSLATPLALITGVVLVVLLLALGWGAWVRTRGRFEAFYFTHFLSIPIGLVCMLHAPWFLQLVALPLGWFLVDRFARLWVTRKAGSVESITVGERDIELVVRRPEAFGYHAGDYAFLCIPEISRVQYHPFSLINAPSQKGSLSFRIRQYGSWTKRLADVPEGSEVYVDGPFASPCRDMHGVSRAVLVAAGIGITPFVSYLEEVRATGVCPFERMHLIWIERDEASFSRFIQLFDVLEARLEGRLTVQLCTKAPSDPPHRLVTEGRLDWDETLDRLSGEGLQGATVFFCGPRSMCQAVREATLHAGMGYRTESF